MIERNYASYATVQAIRIANIFNFSPAHAGTPVREPCSRHAEIKIVPEVERLYGCVIRVVAFAIAVFTFLFLCIVMSRPWD
jgi:hypothetical protein